MAEKRYWGTKAAGMLFLCPDDDTILLMLRSGVADEGLWGIPGGAIDSGYVSNHSDVEDPSVEIFLETALRETKEEAGCLPFEYEIVGETDFKDGSFTYRTFVCQLDKREKRIWSNRISLNEENFAFKWFDKNDLPKNVHQGVLYSLNQI